MLTLQYNIIHDPLDPMYCKETLNPKWTLRVPDKDFLHFRGVRLCIRDGCKIGTAFLQVAADTVDDVNPAFPIPRNIP